MSSSTIKHVISSMGARGSSMMLQVLALLKGAHHMVGCMSKSYGMVAANHGLSYGRPLYHVMSGCYRFLEVSTI